MRVYFAHVIESQDKRLPKDCDLIYKGHPSSNTLKCDVRPFEICKKDGTIETWGTTIGMGYADFKDEEDYDKRKDEILLKKYKEVGIDENTLHS